MASSERIDVGGGYRVLLRYSDEDEGFIAVVPGLPGCSAFGASEVDALREIVPAAEAWIEACKAAGNPVPSPEALA